MRIAFYSDNFYPELSGITDTILITGKELTKRGHKVVYVGARYSPADYIKANRTYPLTAADDQVDGMPIVRLPSVRLPFSPTGQSRFAFPTGASFDYLDTFKPEVIHTQSPYTVGHEARRAAKRYRAPLVGTNHTAIEDFFPVPAVMRRFDAWYYNHCDFVSAPYQRLIERMREVGFNKPGRAVRNPAELGAFSPAVGDEKAEHKQALGLEGPVLLYSGRLGVEKRVDVLVRAVAELVKEFPTLTLVATGHGAAEPSLRKLAAQLGVTRNIRFTGFLSRQALAHVYKAADMFAFMSTSDSQSIALMQAYAAGLPALCADARGLPDFTPKECGFLIEPGNYRALAEKAALLIKDAGLRERMSAAAAAYAQHFAPAKIADEWEQIYRDAIGKK